MTEETERRNGVCEFSRRKGFGKIISVVKKQLGIRGDDKEFVVNIHTRDGGCGMSVPNHSIL